jgi:hyperosmotically inducible periplasmic protein
MKPILAKIASTTALSLALAFAVQSTSALAQSAPTSRAAARKANHQLERNVQRALSAAKIDITDIRVVAKHGEIGLDGEVANTSDIDKAADVAGKVDGVTSVKNYLTVYEEGGK